MGEYRRAILLVAFVLLQGCRAEWPFVPQSPCPTLFPTYISQTYEVYSVIKLSNDLSGVYDLEVNMSIAMDTNRNIGLRRAVSDYEIRNGEKLVYYVTYPYNHTFPKLTSITFNKKLLCVGPPEYGSPVTPLSKRDILKVDVVDGIKPRASEPPQKVEIQININSSNEDEECGVINDYRPLVLQGEQSKQGEHPWLVALLYLENESYSYYCAGTLISNKHVITAAHCVKTNENIDLDKEDLLLVFGRDNIKNWAVKSTLRGVKKIMVHPDYVAPSDSDVAVLVTDRPVQFGFLIKPVCLWDEPIALHKIVDKKGVVAGWGRDESNKNTLVGPKKISIPIVTQETCLASDSRFIRLTSNRTFCAGDREGSIPCVGDSGGGFVMKRGGRWKIRGVVSAALPDMDTGRCDGSNYAIFVDLGQNIAWLNSIMKQD